MREIIELYKNPIFRANEKNIIRRSRREYQRMYQKRKGYKSYDPLLAKTRPIVLERDGYKCTKCGKNKKLCVHHIKGDGLTSSIKDKDHTPNNLVTLCTSCHSRLHHPVTRHPV